MSGEDKLLQGANDGSRGETTLPSDAAAYEEIAEQNAWSPGLGGSSGGSVDRTATDD